jgi:hypothetical protein
MSTVRGVVLSTTPGSPTVIPTGTSGTLAGGEPFYNYGSIANGATGSTNWRFSIPSVTPFRFGFTVQHGSGTDAAPGKNQAPSVVSVTPASGSVSAGNSTTITATTSDPNSDSLTYTWSAPSGGSISGTGATVTYTAPGAPGTYPVNVIVDDGKGATANGSTTISVTAGGGNGTAQGNASFGPTPAAAVKQVTLSPAAVTIDPGEPLTITATGRDNPGNAVATKWTWSQVGSTNSIWRGTFDHGTSGNTATWRSFDGRTDSGTVTITARSADNQKASMTITVREKPPVVQAASPAATVTVNRNVATPFSVTFHDPNGNNTGAPSISVPPSVGYSGGSSFNQITGNYTMNLNMTFTALGTFPVTITQSDGSGSGTKTWNVTVI